MYRPEQRVSVWWIDCVPNQSRLATQRYNLYYIESQFRHLSGGQTLSRRFGLRLKYPSIRAMMGTIRSTIAITWPKVHCWLSDSVDVGTPHKFTLPQTKAMIAQHTFRVSELL
jgi:hypothetical protein